MSRYTVYSQMASLLETSAPLAPPSEGTGSAASTAAAEASASVSTPNLASDDAAAIAAPPTASKGGRGGGKSGASATGAKAFINMPLPELYQRRLLMLRELNSLEDAIKSLEAQQSSRSAAATTSLAAAIEGQLRALALQGADAAEGADGSADRSDDADPSAFDDGLKEAMRRSAALLVAAYEEAHGDKLSGSVFIPPAETAEAVRRNAAAFALGLIRRGTSSLGGLKECNRIAELVCAPAAFDSDATPSLRTDEGVCDGAANVRDYLTRYYSLLARLHFRQIFIGEVIRHSAHLVTDALGSALLQRAIPLMLSGDALPGVAEPTRVGAFWYNVASAAAAATATAAEPTAQPQQPAPTSTSKGRADVYRSVPTVCIDATPAALWDCSFQLSLVRRPSAAAAVGTAATAPSELLLLIAALGAPTLADAACHTHGTRAVFRIAESIRTVAEYAALLLTIEGRPFYSPRTPKQRAAAEGGAPAATDSAASSEGSAAAATSPPLRLTSKFISLLIDMNGNSVMNKLLASPLLTAEGDAAACGAGGADSDGDSDRSASSASRAPLTATALRRQVYGVIAAKCLDVCRNRQGCCTIQRCIVGAPEPYKQQMIDVVLANALKLVQDPFGNYVIQFLLDGPAVGTAADGSPLPASGGKGGKKAPSRFTNLIIRQLLHHIPTLSTNKFSSNVIEKCLKSASSDVKQLLIDELTEPQALPKLLVDSYANYVVQTAIETAADEAQFRQLRDAITPLQHLLRNSPYGGKIETRLERRQRDIHSQKRSQQQQQQQMDGQSVGGKSYGAAAPPAAARGGRANSNGGGRGGYAVTAGPFPPNGGESNLVYYQQPRGAFGGKRGGGAFPANAHHHGNSHYHQQQQHDDAAYGGNGPQFVASGNAANMPPRMLFTQQPQQQGHFSQNHPVPYAQQQRSQGDHGNMGPMGVQGGGGASQTAGFPYAVGSNGPSGAPQYSGEGQFTAFSGVSGHGQQQQGFYISQPLQQQSQPQSQQSYFY